MITLLTGDNSFDILQAIKRLQADFAGQAETIDGGELTLRQLPDLLMGATLFADQRLVIIKRLSDNSVVWSDFGDWIPRIADNIHVVLVEAKPDKRTKTYKELKAAATVREFASWSDRDSAKAEAWIQATAKEQGSTLSRGQAKLIVERVGIDQWQLYQALEKLAAYPEVSDALIREVIDATPSANVFALLETALRGDGAKLHEMIETLETTSEPYQLLALLGAQVFQLAALMASDKPVEEVAKDLGAHPYALKQLAKLSHNLTRAQAKKIVTALAEADHDSKTTGEDPWLLVERALQKIAALTK